MHHFKLIFAGKDVTTKFEFSKCDFKPGKLGKEILGVWLPVPEQVHQSPHEYAVDALHEVNCFRLRFSIRWAS